MNRASSKSKIGSIETPMQRASSKQKLGPIDGGSTPTMPPKKLKLRSISISRVKDQPAKQKPKELYGLDVEFLEGLGLGNMIENSP